jgi:hypothetical protein
MNLIAGFTMPSHPFASDRTVMALPRGILAVSPSVADDVRIQRYKIAAQWCASGPFLPVPWQLSISHMTFETRTNEAMDKLRQAVCEIGSTVEFAFRLDGRAFEQDSVLRPTEGESEGRAYLRRLRNAHPAPLARLQQRLQNLTGGSPFDVPSVRIERGVVEGILSCAATDAHSFGSILARLAAADPDRGMVEGPLPPFGTAARSLASIGFHVGRPDS